MKRFLSLALALMMVLSMVSFNVFALVDPGEEILAAAGADGIDEGTVITLFDEPVTTTFGTMADLVPGGYVAKTDGARGFALILKIDGIAAGETPVIGKINPSVTLGGETKDPIWNGNWVTDAYNTNSYVLTGGNGYYLYWFPFKNIDNAWTNVATTKGETKLNRLNIFHATAALGNNRAGQVAANDKQTVTCLGIIEGSISDYDVYAYDKNAEKYESVKSGVKIDAAAGGNNAQWVKVKNPTELFGADFGADEMDLLTGWLDRDGKEVDFPLGIKIVEPTYETIDPADIVTVTFVDDKGAEVATARAVKGHGILDDYPLDQPKQGVLTYEFLGWSVDGENKVDLATYDYTGDVTVQPLYKSYGVFFDAEPVALTTEAGLSLLPAKVAMPATSHGVTVVYKVEGADTDIVADNLIITMNGNADPAWQYVNKLYAGNGIGGPNVFTITNGYHYIYFNQNINGTNGKTPTSFDKFTINNAKFSAANFPDPNKDSVAREPENENDNATFQMLAVIPDNLQPTVTFVSGGKVVATQQIKYTDINANLGYGTLPQSCSEGVLKSADEAYEMTGLEAPTQTNSTFEGWVDANGNAVTAVYDDVTVYAKWTVDGETAQSDYYFEINAEPVKIPTVAEGLNGVTLWEGNDVDFGEGAGIVTFVIKATGIDKPVSLSRFLPTYTMQNAINTWAVDNTWGGGNTGLDGVGTEHALALNIPKDGAYVISIGRKVFGMDAAGKVLTVSKLRVADINNSYKNTYPLVNDNENAQISLLSISAGNPKFTANFYDEFGGLIGTATKEYPQASEASDSTTVKKTTCLTVGDMFELTGAQVPTKDADAAYKYVLQWVDSEGNPVDAVYKNMDVFVSWKAIDNTVGLVTFNNADGKAISTTEVKKGTNPSFEGVAPAKDATADETYTFAGWSVDGETVVDLAEYVVEDDVTFVPVYVADEILKAEVVIPESVAMGETVEATIKINRTDLTTDVLEGTKEAITSGEVVITYTAALLAAEGGNGTITVPFTAVAEDGTVAKVVFTAAADAAGKATVAVQSGKVSTETVADAAVVGLSANIAVTGQQVGAYFNGGPVVINKNKEDGTGPDRQVLWKGNVVTGGSDGVTFVYKVDGIETAINASNLNIVLNSNVHAWNSWNWQNGGNTGGKVSAEQIFDANGYFLMYVNSVPNGGNVYNTVNEFIVFQNPNDIKGPDRDNENANATFQMLAVVADNLAPTVTFCDVDGTALATTTKQYTNYSGSMWSANAKTVMALESPKALYEAQIEAAGEENTLPTTFEKASDINKVSYVWEGEWEDADGNVVDAVYMSGDLYPHFTVVDEREYYTIKFVNEDGTELQSSSVPEEVVPEYKGATPTKAPEGNTSYTFAGWDKTVVAATGEATYTATYKSSVIYPIDREAIAINKTNGNAVPATQTLWSGEFDMGNADGITIVYKLDGVEMMIDATMLDIGATKANGAGTVGNWNWNWNTYAAHQVFEANGYYYIYLNRTLIDGQFKTIKDITIFRAREGFDRTPENENDNATIDIVAIASDNLAPTVTFHGADDAVLGMVTKKYTNFSGNVYDGAAKAEGALVTPADLYAELVAANADLPTVFEKASDIEGVTYEFDGWADKDGNLVEAVYLNGDLYPHFKTIDERTYYTIKFVDEDGTELQTVSVLEGAMPEFTGEDPTKDATAEFTYTFKGWDAEIVEATADATYTAVYDSTVNQYTVTFVAEDGTTEVGTVTVDYGTAATAPTAPEKDPVDGKVYVFAAWVDAEGNEADLSSIVADITVKASYTEAPAEVTVTFVAEDGTEVGKVTVNFGEDVTAPEAPAKATEKFTAYTFDKWVDADGNEAVLTAVKADATVTATYTESFAGEEITDINPDAWYMTQGVLQYGLMNGLIRGMDTEGKVVAPDATMTRAQLATILYRMQGEPDVADMADPTLSDYNASAWWADAMKWAVGSGIINGNNINGNILLDADGKITRLQMVTMMYRYADKVCNYDMGEIAEPDFTAYEDGDVVNYSQSEMMWAIGAGYVQGTTVDDVTYLTPNNNITRAQAMAILMRFNQDEHAEKAPVEETPAE